MPRKSSRRDFLRGAAVGDAFRDTVDQGLPESREATAPAGGTPGTSEAYLTRVSRAAMACQFEVLVNAGQYPTDVTAALEALDRVEALEGQLSYFRPDSEISRLNALAADEAVPVEPRLFQLLELSQQLSAETEGALDLTASPLWETWGFARHAGRVPSANEIAAARQCVGSHLMELDPEHQTVRFRRPGVKLSLGSIGKGYALDRAAEVLTSFQIDDFLFHGGQSSILARGRRLDSAATEGWTVGVRHPLRPGERLAEIRLVNQALGTSNTGRQFFRHQGQRYGHILDPRSGWPAAQLLSVTVVAPSATLADGLATAFFVLGAEATRRYCQRHPEIGALLMLPNQTGAAELECVGPLQAQFRPGEGEQR